MTLAGVIIAGYIVAAVPLVHMLRELAHSDPHRPGVDGRADPWKQGKRAAWLAYLAGGWPLFVVVAAWHTSDARRPMATMPRPADRATGRPVTVSRSA